MIRESSCRLVNILLGDYIEDYVRRVGVKNLEEATQLSGDQAFHLAHVFAAFRDSAELANWGGTAHDITQTDYVFTPGVNGTTIAITGGAPTGNVGTFTHYVRVWKGDEVGDDSNLVHSGSDTDPIAYAIPDLEGETEYTIMVFSHDTEYVRGQLTVARVTTLAIP